MSCYTFNGITLSEEALFERILNELDSNPDLNSLATAIYKIDDPKQTLDKIREDGKAAEKRQRKAGRDHAETLPYIPVTKFITAVHYPSKKLLSPEYNEENRKAQWIKDHLSEYNLDKTKAAEAFEREEGAEIDRENSQVGTFVHELVNIILEHKVNSDEYRAKAEELENILKGKDGKYSLAETLTANDSPSVVSKTPEEKAAIVKRTIEATAKQVANWVHTTFPDCEVYSEIPMVLNKQLMCQTIDGGIKTYEGVLGVADLILLNKNTGEVTLVDYKVSGKKYRDWSAAKTNEVDYQLALYRAMLSEFGFDGNKIKLFIKPILYEKQNISSLAIAEDTIDKTDARTSGASRIAWKGGSFTANLRDLGIGQKIVYDKKDDPKFVETINSDLENIITYEDSVIISKEWMIDNKLEAYKDDLGKIVGYRIWSTITNKYITAPTKEEFTAEGGLIDIYITELKAARNAIGTTIIKKFSKYKADREAGKEIDDMQFLDTKNKLSLEVLLNYIGRYVNNGWEFEPISDELLDRGILIFSKQDGKTGEKIIEVVTIALAPLMKTISINGEQTVLGKYLSDEEVKQLPFKALKSEYRHVKAIETLSILNSLMKERSDIFQNCQFNKLLILNPKGTVSEHQRANLLDVFDNFNLLCTKANIENKISTVKIPSTCDHAMQEAFELLSPLKEDKTFKSILRDIENNEDNLELLKKGISRLLKLLLEKYPNKLQHLSENTNARIDTTDKIQVCYVMLSLIYAHLNNMKIDYTGRPTTYAVSAAELFSFFGVVIHGRQALTDWDGDNISGLGNGLETSSPRTMPSDNLLQLNAAWSAAQLNVRSEFLRQTTFLSKLNKDFVTKVGGSHMLANASYMSVWEHLLAHEGTKINPDLKVKNPYDMSNDLTTDEREYLKLWLWEVNKWKINQAGLETEWHYKDHQKEIDNNQEIRNMIDDETYFQLPLVRSDSYQRARSVMKGNYGFTQYVKDKWKDFEETYDPRGLHNMRRELIKRDSGIWMYDNYELSQGRRKELLASEPTPYNFCFDLDFISLDVAFNKIRKKYYDDVILLHLTTMTLLNFTGQTTGAEFEEEKEAAENLLKIMKGESLLTRGEEKIAKSILSPIKQMNSIVMLACRPLLFLKELSFGLFVNYSRAWSLKMGDSSNGLSINSVTKASSILWGQRLTKWGKSIVGNGSLADFYLCELLNNLYGIANADTIRAARNASIASNGMINNASRWMYLAQSAPDYYNRMTLFLAKMIEDGCFDAHELLEDGIIHYNWKKDKRFSELAKHGLNSNYSSSEYNKLKALYVKMCEEFKDPDLIKWDPTLKRYIYGDLKEAYTSQLRDSIKEVSDMAYGFYDHETKSQINHKFTGLVFLQFQTYLSAMYNRWFKGGSRRGANTAQGLFVLIERNGVKYYNRHIISNTGEYIRTEQVAETELTEEEKRTLIPAMEWKGDFVEGMVYSILYTVHDIFTMNWKDVWNNKQRLANIALALHDILFGILIVSILKTIFSGGSGKMADIEPLKRTLIRGMQDVGPLALSQISITPSFVTTLLNFKTDGLKMLTGSDSLADSIAKHIGASRDFTWNEN